MIPTWMIEELERRRQERVEQERQREQPRLEIPTPLESTKRPEPERRGVIIIEL